MWSGPIRKVTDLGQWAIGSVGQACAAGHPLINGMDLEDSSLAKVRKAAGLATKQRWLTCVIFKYADFLTKEFTQKLFFFSGLESW